MMIVIMCSWNTANDPAIAIQGTITDAADGSVLQGVNIVLKGTKTGAITDINGNFKIDVPNEKAIIVISLIGYVSHEITVGSKRQFSIRLQQDIQSLSEVVVTGHGSGRKGKAEMKLGQQIMGIANAPVLLYDKEYEQIGHNTEGYSTIHENIFLETTKNPLSTFSIDVDNASYSNMRRYINQGQKPPVDAIRIEEMINYFTYDYPQPKGEDPFSVNTELSGCPWNPDHQLLHIGLQGRQIATDALPPSNLVFLIDVSGSMDTPERLPLVKAGFKLLVDALRPQDRVSIVVYAGAAGVVLPATAGSKKTDIMAAIENLQAGGSTAGGAGIEKAYALAADNFIEGGNNRVILATDGDFNVGVSSDAAMERLIEAKRKSGVYLTVLGFGMGNYKDSKMKILASKGNGNYAYIDNLMEAKKVFVNEFGGTLFTIAKDVKLQLEFNPEKVKGYRLIGYETRALKNEDFNNDQKDAGELGSGHTVTALYEIIPAAVAHSPFLMQIDTLKYQKMSTVEKLKERSNDLLTIKLRYKKPDSDESKLIEKVVFDQSGAIEKTSENFRFAAAVASFGMLLRDSEFKGNSNYASVLALALGARGEDEEGYRAEFIHMVRSSQLLARK